MQVVLRGWSATPVACPYDLAVQRSVSEIAHDDDSRGRWRSARLELQEPVLRVGSQHLETIVEHERRLRSPQGVRECLGPEAKPRWIGDPLEPPVKLDQISIEVGNADRGNVELLRIEARDISDLVPIAGLVRVLHVAIGDGEELRLDDEPSLLLIETPARDQIAP